MTHQIPPDMSWKDLYEWVEKDWPTVYRLLYPKIYEFEGNYHSPKMPAVMIIHGLADITQSGIKNAPISHQLVFPAACYLAQHMTPTFFIAPDLLKAIQMTDIHEEIDWVDLKLPFESAVFIIPNNGYSHPLDGECAFIIYVRHKPGYFQFPADPDGPSHYYEDETFAILGFIPNTRTWYHVNLNASFSRTTKLRNLFQTEDGKPRLMPRGPIKNPEMDLPLAPEDDPFVESLGVIAFGTLLAMTARPELLEKSTLLRKVPGKKGKLDKEFWTPNIVGRKYRLKRELGGTHASPRMHWRRGHYRLQAYGENLTERKRIWIEPCLVSATDNNKAEAAQCS